MTLTNDASAIKEEESLEDLSLEDRGHLVILLRAFTVMELWVAITEKETQRYLAEMESDKVITSKDVQNQVALFLSGLPPGEETFDA